MKKYPLFALLSSVLVVLIDRIIKLIALSLRSSGSSVLIPHILELTWAQNTGISFGLFSNGTVFFIILTALICLVIIALLFKEHYPVSRQLLLGMILGGAFGNLLDRVIYGYVIDMFNFLFIDFAVFNFADVCIVTGCILLMLFILFDKGEIHRGKDPHSGP